MIGLHQTWHERFHQNPADKWLQQLLCDQSRADRRHAAAAPANLNPTTP